MTKIKILKETLNFCINTKNTNRLHLLIDEVKSLFLDNELLVHLKNIEYENDFVLLIDRLMHNSENEFISNFLKFVLDSELVKIKEI